MLEMLRLRVWWSTLVRSPHRGTIAAVCLLLAVIHTWPLATAPGTLSRNDNGDAQLNEWIMSWVARQLPRAPARLFHGNIFYPARNTLAYSEPLIVPALLGAPIRWLGGSPVLMYNIMLIVGFALTAWAGYTLVYSWTGDRYAGLLTGSMFAFNTHTLTRLAHIQAIHAWGLPLALLAADRIIVRARFGDSARLAIWMAALAYTSGYLVVFGAVMLAVGIVARLTDWWPRPTAVLSRFVAAALIGGVITLPLFLPYRRVAIEQGMVRSLGNVAEYSATLQGYMATAGRIHFSTWSGAFFQDPVDSFFPGVIVAVLAALCVVWRIRRTVSSRPRPQPDASGETDAISGVTASRVFMLVAIAATGFVLSLGTQTPVYGWVFQIFPPMQGLRAAARFGNLFLLGTTVLAGLGLALLRQRLGARRTLAGAALVILANVESLRAPLYYTRFEGIPPIYSLLKYEPGRVVLAEVPFYPPQAVFENAGYVLASTAHWRPLMNGYSGYTPESYRDYAAAFWYFPEDHAVQAMRRAGVTHVMVHLGRFHHEADKTAKMIADCPYLERIAIGRHGIMLYRLH